MPRSRDPLRKDAFPRIFRTRTAKLKRTKDTIIIDTNNHPWVL